MERLSVMKYCVNTRCSSTSTETGVGGASGTMSRTWRGRVCFFFSSRRRHTRFDCDWSSDVCSSDLFAPGMHGANRTGRPFTGDYAGILLYETLYELGLATRSESVSTDDGLELRNARIDRKSVV